MAENEEKSEVSQVERISEDLLRTNIYSGSNTSMEENEEESKAAIEQTSEDLQGTHISSGDEVAIYGNPGVGIPGVPGHPPKVSPCMDQGGSFLRAFSKVCIDVVGSHLGRCFR